MSNQPAVLGPDGVARPYIGGQALIEGVMMRSPHAFAAVLRRKSGELVVREEPMRDLRRGVWAWPLLRGVAALVEALRLGSRALRFSAEVYERDMNDESEEPKSTSPGLLSLLSLPIIALVTNEPAPPTAPAAAEGKGRTLMTVLSVLFALGLFIALPQAFAAGISKLLALDLDVRSTGFQALTGAAKMLIIVGYMLVIRRIPEIYRVFQYHGAEHKSIYTYESGEELTVENARRKTTLHPRCGTTFIVMVALVSIVVFSVIAPLLPDLGLSGFGDNVLLFALKLPFLPFIAAITFELQRLLARLATRGPLRLLLWPGFLVQKITTIEPDDTQLEVALGALAVTLGREKTRRDASAADQHYPSYAELLSSAAPVAPAPAAWAPSGG
jgi:uncharacterized protein YqhQ